jgi:hypothetical protein
MIKDQVSIILDDIYSKIFLKELDYSINIFLCGANPNDKNSIRHLLYEEIKDKSQYNIVFPEWLFSNLLVRKEYNLLNLEHDLASSVDVIVLPIEGMGTLVELGAFSSFDKLRDRIIVINDEKYKSKRSFITLGPIKLIKQTDSRNVIYYNKGDPDPAINKRNLDDLKKNVLSRVRLLNRAESKYDIKNLFNLSRFILYIIAIFQPINESEILELLDNLKKGIPHYYLDPCLQNLIEKQKIDRNIIRYKNYYSLTHSGHLYIYEDLLPRLKIIKVFSKTRAKIIRSNNRNISKWSLDGEVTKFLVV